MSPLLATDNYIDGQEFLVLKEEDVYKMVPPVGLAKKVLRLLPSKEVAGGGCKSVPPVAITKSRDIWSKGGGGGSVQ